MDQLPPKLLTTLSQAADLVRGNSFFQVYSHYDADGVSSAAIISKALIRAGKEFKVTLFTTLNDNNMNVIRASKCDCVIVSDLGASYIDQLDAMDLPVIVLDHHTIISEADRIVYANPHLYGIDGMTSGCGATMSLLFAVTLDESNWDLVQVAFAGIAGDRQHINGLTGLNAYLLEEGTRRGYIIKRRGSLIPSGNLMSSLYLCTDPYIRGVSGEVEGVAALLKEAGISNDRTYEDLDEDEARRLSSLIAIRLTQQGMQLESMAEISRDRYVLKDWGMDAERLSALLNSSGRAGLGGAGVAAGLGDVRCLRLAAETDESSSEMLVKAMRELDSKGLNQREHFQWFDSGESGFTGMLCSIAMQCIGDHTKPTIGMNTSSDPVNLSSRGMFGQLDRGINLAVAMREACASVDGAGGGHRIAAGGSVPLDRVEEFLDNLDRILGEQLAAGPEQRSAPGDLDLVGPEPLEDGGLGHRHAHAGRVHLAPQPCDHRAVVPAVLALRDVHLGTPRMGHLPYHVAQAAVLGHAPAEQDLVLPYVRHRALRDLREHGERRLLHRERYVLQRDALPVERDGGCYHPGERHVHALDGVRQLMVLGPLTGQPLKLRAGVEPHAQVPAQLVQHVPYADVLGLAEDPVPPLGVGYDLGVPSRCVQQGRVPAARLGAAYLDMRYAVVDAYYRHADGAGERPGGRGGHPEAWSQAGTHGEGHQVDVGWPDARLVERGRDRPRRHVGMMVSRLAGVQAALRGTEHVDLVRQDVAVRIDDADAERVRGTLDPQREHDAPCASHIITTRRVRREGCDDGPVATSSERAPHRSCARLSNINYRLCSFVAIYIIR